LEFTALIIVKITLNIARYAIKTKILYSKIVEYYVISIQGVTERYDK